MLQALLEKISGKKEMELEPNKNVVVYYDEENNLVFYHKSKRRRVYSHEILLQDDGWMS